MSGIETTPHLVETVAVLGAGTMGHGIAQVAASAGYRVIMRDVSTEIISRGIRSIERNLTRGIELGKLTEADLERTLQNIRGTVRLDETAEADLFIEAAPEILELKQSVLREVESLARKPIIYATNTSSLSISEIAKASANPDRVIGMHFFNPVHLMRLVEVVKGDQTSEQTAEITCAVVRKMKKEPITVKDVPGFASSRLGVVLGLEAMRMVEQGVASAKDIDTAMELGYNHPMGPLRLTDLVGLDIRLNIADYLHRKLKSESFRPPDILRRMVAEGKLGKKSGHGFYDWND